IGPDNVLLAMSKSIRLSEKSAGGVTVPLSISSVLKGKSEDEVLLNALGQLYRNGVTVDWKQVYKKRRVKKLALPVYPFKGERYWPEETQEKQIHQLAVNPTGRPEKLCTDMNIHE